MNDQQAILWRGRLLFGALFVALAVIVWALTGAAVFRRAELLGAASSLSRQEGEIPPPRGAIFDGDGVKLAWSEQFFDLVGSAQLNGELHEDLLAELARRLPRLFRLKDSDQEQVLAPALTPEEYERLKLFIARHQPLLHLEVRIERRTLAEPTLQQLLGEVHAGRGESGIEAELDSRLRGRPGRYQVDLDRHGNWVSGTWRELAPMVPGEDIHLDLPWRDWVAQESGGAEW